MIECRCRQCIIDDVHKNRELMVDGQLIVFTTCSTCGNKRCPHATDHRNECTNSNEPGQPGSVYQ